MKNDLICFGCSLRQGVMATVFATVVTLTLLSCNGAESPVNSHGGPAQDHVSLVDNLRAQGLTVSPTGSISQPFFAVPGQILRVNGQDIQVFEYASSSAAQTQAHSISPDGKAIDDTIVGWVGPTHFYQNGKILVLYIGSDQTVLKTLGTLLGPQIAGEP
ncbi:MAG: hypothetical protein MRJ96_08705 [Nitrospirales bacterium]|nr:hypothetical protein [Nitrospira sp.]MDR4501513.1 hypothetical protein [Nitrospirales bacterium]